MAELNRHWRWHCAALLFYAAASFVFIDHGAALSDHLLGRGSDPFAFIWCLAWWPWALLHHVNPFWSHLIWQPLGVALLWTSAVPLLAAVIAPVTIWFGPVIAYNALVLVAPVLSAWCMYRFCLGLAGRPGAALIGGYIFGFSTYQMAEAATLNLSFTCALPLLGWVVLARLRERCGHRTAIGVIATVMAGEFLISPEICAIMVLFGGILWLLAMALVRGRQGALVALFLDVLAAGALAGLATSPFLVAMLAHRQFIRLPPLWPFFFTADPFGFFLPGPNTLLAAPVLARLLNGFFGDVQEQCSYLGLPLLLIVYHQARTTWRWPETRFLVVSFGLLVICSLGPKLWLAGHFTGLPLPWLALMQLPLLAGALPVRFALYISFAAAIIAVLWLTAIASPRAAKLRLGAGILACIAIIPGARPVQPIPHAVFFEPGRLQSVLGTTSRILILPFAINGASSFWQAENQFGFSQTGGYLGYPPAAMQAYPVVQQLFGRHPENVVAADFVDFIAATQTQFVIAGPGTPPVLLAKLKALNWPARNIDDVTVFTVPALAATPKPARLKRDEE